MTTLTTIGFGDICPKSNLERIIIAIYVLCGVSIFSKISGDFLEMLTSYHTLNDVYQDFDRLQQFFGILKKFNYTEPVEKEFQDAMVDYFEYRWEKYKYFVFIEYSDLVGQLPIERIDLLLRGIVYRPFLDNYSHVLTCEKNIRYSHARYTWSDKVFRHYMRSLLSILEPIHVPQDYVLIHELDAFQEVTFFI